MSKYTIYYSGRKDMYRRLAISWARFAAEYKLPPDQQKGMSLFFSSLAKRFGLVNEFRDIGVI